MKKGGILVILLLTGLICQAQSLSRPVERLSQKLAQQEMIMSQTLGQAKEANIPYDLFSEICAVAKKKELLLLLDHASPIVRGYAFWALALQGKPRLYPLLTRHLTDTQFVAIQIDTRKEKIKLADFYVEVATSPDLAPEVVKLSAKQRDKLDELLIDKRYPLEATANALLRSAPTPERYDRFRQLVQEGSLPAMVALAGYQKAEDLALILSCKAANPSHPQTDAYFYQAVERFPHPDFLPVLEADLRRKLEAATPLDQFEPLFQALISYENEAALALLELPLTAKAKPGPRNSYLQVLFRSLEAHPAPVFDELLWTLWEEEFRISPSVYERLNQLDSARAGKATQKSLENIGWVFGYNNLQAQTEYGKPNPFMVFLLERVVREDSVVAEKIITDNIAKAGVHTFRIFSDQLRKHPDPRWAPTLFKRLAREWNPHIFIDIVELLLTMEDPDIRHGIEEVRAQNPKLNEGWGGEILDKLLQDQ